MSTVTIQIPGIHCDNCKSSIEGALNGIEGVQTAEVSVEDKQVTVKYDDDQVSVGVLHDAIIEQGYDLEE